jgi:hypothetical protein
VYLGVAFRGQRFDVDQYGRGAESRMGSKYGLLGSHLL